MLLTQLSLEQKFALTYDYEHRLCSRSSFAVPPTWPR